MIGGTKMLDVVTKLVLVILLCSVAMAPADARPRGSSNYDGAWHLTFMTRTGPCDAAYEFDVNISNGEITEPNLVKFHGRVLPGGAVRASVTVHDKFASGSGRLIGATGQGSWRGRPGEASCSGYWTARKG